MLSLEKQGAPQDPLAGGVDAEAFARHYAQARQDRKLQLAQRVYNGWHLYVAPLALGSGPPSLVADHYFGSDADILYWILAVYGTALFVTPALMMYRRRRHAHRRFQVFYRTALERCMVRTP